MSAEEEANLHKQIQDFSHTITPSSASDIVTMAADPNAALLTGTSLHEELLRRAEQKAHLDSSLSENLQFRDYKNSMIGSIGQSQETRRAMTLVQRAERQAREERFKNRQHAYRQNRDDTSQSGRRRVSDTDRSLDHKVSDSSATRQGFINKSSKQTQPRIGFQEPKSRDYNPFK